MDLYKGYIQCRVDPRDQHYLTFVTPFGRYRYCRLPMGFADSSDQFLLATKSLCEGIPRVSKVMDDILGEPSSLSEMASQLEEICSRASKKGIIQWFPASNKLLERSDHRTRD